MLKIAPRCESLDIELPPAESHCAICSNQCLLECLKCQKCKHFIHTDCSELPVYSIVNFLKSRSQYTCEPCARKIVGKQCDRLFAQVLSVVQKEKEAKQQINPKNNITKDSITTDSENSGRINEENNVNQESPLNYCHDLTTTITPPVKERTANRVTTSLPQIMINECKPVDPKIRFVIFIKSISANLEGVVKIVHTPTQSYVLNTK